MRANASKGRHTNDSNVGEYWKSATPRDGTQIGPLHVHFPGCASQELIQYTEDDESDDLRKDSRCDRQSLNNEV